MNSEFETVELNNPYFEEAVLDVINSYQIEEIVETGTHNGTGSTRIFAETGLPVKTIEIQRAHHKKAQENLKDFKNVECFLGLSLKYEDMLHHIYSNELYFHGAETEGLGCEPAPCQFYKSEINGWDSPDRREQVEDLLPSLIDNEKKQLILLDSAGGVGLLEYQRVQKLTKERLVNKVLFLDDIHHVKHARSIIDLKDNGYDVQELKDGRSAYCNFMNQANVIEANIIISNNPNALGSEERKRAIQTLGQEGAYEEEEKLKLINPIADRMRQEHEHGRASLLDKKEE